MTSTVHHWDLVDTGGCLQTLPSPVDLYTVHIVNLQYWQFYTYGNSDHKLSSFFLVSKNLYLISEILNILWSGMLEYESCLDRNQKYFHILVYNPFFLISNSSYVKYTAKIRILTNDPPPPFYKLIGLYNLCHVPLVKVLLCMQKSMIHAFFIN